MRNVKIIFALMFLSLSSMASAINFFATSNYYQANYQDLDPTYRGICIGGEICGVDNSLYIFYPHNTYLSLVQVYANDDVSSKTKARLELLVDGVSVDIFDVKKDGSTLKYEVNRTVKGYIELRSLGETDDKTDETVIESIMTF